MLRRSVKSSSHGARRRGGVARRNHASVHVAAQPAHFQMADGTRATEAEHLATETYARLFKDHGMFDPTVDPQYEIFQVERFWQELDAQFKAWEEACRVVDAIRNGDACESSEKTVEQAVMEVHLLGDKLFAFFTHMRAHLDRNPRDRLGFHSARPAHLTDVFGKFLKVLARQIDTDYCPRCHLRLDGTTTVCGDPATVGKYHYGNNPVFGFEAQETEHSFWSASWFAEYEKRAKALWYQALQLPFFRTEAHTAEQCEGMMEVYRATLNRAEANHFLHQCQVHGLPITQRMVACHEEILGSTNPHQVFFHGDPEAVSPRLLRYKIEQEKLDGFADEHGLIKYPPPSYLPHSRGEHMYAEIPERFSTDDRNWVSNYQEVTAKIQDTVDGWSPTEAQRSHSAEFPDWAYDEATLGLIQHYRSEVAKAKVKARPTPFKVRNKSVARWAVPGLFGKKEEKVVDEGREKVVFPTASGYEQFDTSDDAFKPLHWGAPDADFLRHSIKPGARLRAVSLQHYITPHVPAVTHRFPIAENTRDLTEEDIKNLPVVEFTAAPRAIYETLLYATQGNPSESIEEWRKRGGRPWCEGRWMDIERGDKKFKRSGKDTAGGLRLGTNFYHGAKGKKGAQQGSVLLVGAYDGKLWAARSGERFASVVLGSTLDDLAEYERMPGDMWAVQENVEVEGIIVGMKDEQVWVQWGPNAVATPIGGTMEQIEQNFRDLQVLPSTAPAVEPPSWCIPFRNNWADEELKKALRAPWDAQEFTPQEPHQLPTLPFDRADPASYKLDDYRTKEYNNRLAARNLLGGSTRLATDRRYTDDVVFSVNMHGDNAMHTGYGQPQVDADELGVPLGVEDGSNDVVPGHEITDVEQALRDISGRAPGAVDPDVAGLAPDAAVNDPITVRRHSQLQMSKRTSLVTDPNHPTYQEIDALDKGQLAQKQQVDQAESWEFGGWADAGLMQILPHQQAGMTGKNPRDAPHTRLHLNGKENEYLSVPKQYQSVVKTFKAMNEFYSDMNKPYDVGHNENPFGPNFDPLRPRDLAKKSMAVGTKRRMAALLLRLWIKKAEKTRTTLRDFASLYKLHRLALLSWFGGDAPASPSLLRALKHWLRDELDELDLLDEFTIEDADTYSPVYEPGFYKWLDKSRFEHQHELLLSAKLQRFASVQNLTLVDPLSQRAETSGGLDSSQRQELEKYERRLMAGNTNAMSRDSLSEYDNATKSTLPRVQVVVAQGKGGARINNFAENLGIDRENISKDAKTFGVLTLAELHNAIYQTELNDMRARGKQGNDEDMKRKQELEKMNILDARTCLSFTKDWDEGLAMDLLYAVRRNMGNTALRASFADLVTLGEAASAQQATLDGLYEHRNGAFRVKGDHVENATEMGDEWEGKLEKDGENAWSAVLTITKDNKKYEDGARLRLKRVSDCEVEWCLGDEADALPAVATAKRADLDVEGAMWRLYVKGEWVPGVEEAEHMVFEWTKKNTQQVKWELETEGLKAPDVAFIQAAFDAGLPMDYGPVSRGARNAITRTVTASGNLADVDSWVSNIPYPGLPNDAAAALKIDYKELTFTFECKVVASDIKPDAEQARPFEFEAFRTEVAAAEDKWATLGMEGLRKDSVELMRRTGTPNYGALLELLHWLDVIMGKVEADMGELVAEHNAGKPSCDHITVEEVQESTGQKQYEGVGKKFEEYKQIQNECIGQLWEYQRESFEGIDPIVPGNAGYNAAFMMHGNDAAGGLQLRVMYDSQVVSGYTARVVNHRLPLLNWWRTVIDTVGRRKQAHLGALSQRLSSA
eukprot:TRINITY_DN15899_c0_g1_i1.p1 TRINITY_DN15899_c0_g1~~TRINITY_DN15899_c0_g1_i1.p1  ORF type:complete len:1787 (+),score=641.81 TRINITY_DN15899_c0_g1_i1:75-5435(+)